MLASGGRPEGADAAANRLVKQGVNALVSFGFAGGLDPALRAGAVVIPASILSEGRLYMADAALAARFGGLTGHCLLAGTAVAGDAATKRRLHATTHTDAIDLESGSVARVAADHGLPFVAVRAISDPAERDLPPAALVALDRQGRIDLVAVLRSLLRQPTQLRMLLRLGSDAAHARRSLVRLAQRGFGAPSSPETNAPSSQATMILPADRAGSAAACPEQ